MFFLTLCLLDKQPKRLCQMFDIVLRGDNSFYSQRNSRGGFFPDRLNLQPPFSRPTDPSMKTGLGSSAALIVSFLAATFQFYGLDDLTGAS